jgi:hypothetical protein
MHGGADGCLDTLQIKAAVDFAVAENDAQQLLYFAGNFLLDRFRRFFSWAVCAVCSTGRKRQIFRLTSTRSSVRPWNLRNSAISLSAFRRAAGDGRLCVTVLPSIFCVSW